MVHDLGLNGSGGKSSSKRTNGLATQQGQSNGSTCNSIADAETELVHDVIDQVRLIFRFFKDPNSITIMSFSVLLNLNFPTLFIFD